MPHFCLARGCRVIEGQRGDVCSEEVDVPEAVVTEYLVVGEVQCPLHPFPAALRCVHLVVAPAAGLAPGEVRDQRPPPLLRPHTLLPHPPIGPARCFRVPPSHPFLLPLHRRVRPRELLQPPQRLQPVALEFKLVLKIDLVAPSLLLLQEDVDERRLVIRFVIQLIQPAKIIYKFIPFL